MGFLKKLKDTTEKDVEKGTDIGKQRIERGQRLEPKDMMAPRMLPKNDMTKLKKSNLTFFKILFSFPDKLVVN